MTASQLLQKLFTGVSDGAAGIDDAQLRLLLLTINEAAPSADVLTYVRALVGGKADSAVSWLEARLADIYDREAKGVR